MSKTRESSKNDNKLNQTNIIEPKNLKLEKKEIKVKTGIKKNLPINNNNNIKSTSQLKTSLIELKKELKEKEELNQNLQNKIKENENIISNLNNQVINIRSQLAQRNANDLFEMDNLMEKISSMENEKSEQDKKIKLLSEQVSNYSSDIRKSVSANEKLKIDVERYKGVITSLKEEGAIIKITTNGYFLKENLWIGDMVDKINISLHSINKEKYEEISKVKDSYDKVINGIKELRFQYPTLKIGINTVLLRNVNDSKDEIEGLIKFSSSIKADLKFIEAYPKNIKGYVDINEIIKKIETMGYIHQKNNFRKSVFSDGSHTIYIQKCTCSAVSEKEDKQSVCKENNDIYITQDGIINLCRQSDEKINLYNIIKNRKDGELIKVIKDVYYQMGNNCKC